MRMRDMKRVAAAFQPYSAAWSARRTKTDFESNAWRDMIWTTISKEVGLYDEGNYRYASDPYQWPVPSDDLVRNHGVPKGFEMRNFYVEIADVKDPRLTTKGLKSLATQLRYAAFGWMEKEVRARGDDDFLCCKTPKIIVSTCPPPNYKMGGPTSLAIVVQVYIYPRLKPEIKIGEN